jgi:hypothetical protein
MSKYNVETETVQTYEKINSVVLIPSSGKLIFSSSKMIVLADGEEVQESSDSAAAVIDASSDLFKAIMAEYANVEVPTDG